MSAPRQRELVFCHECENEWYRDEHGLTCQLCGSEFTEIIESDHDPRAERFAPLDDDIGANDLPGLHFLGGGPPPQFRQPPSNNTSSPTSNDPLHPFHNHNPWATAPDPDEDDISMFARSGSRGVGHEHTFMPGRPRGMPDPGERPQELPGAVGNNFATRLQSILGVAPADRAFPPLGTQTAQRGNGNVRVITSEGPHHRFTYTATTRLIPRDSNNTQPQIQPFDGLHPMLVHLYGSSGTSNLPGERDAGGEATGQQPLPPNPIIGLLSTLLGGGHGQGAGDYVFNQEQLDRVISQLMEQNTSGSAPGPASQDAIKSLPKKPIIPEMLGAEGRAECSICMDEVNIGEEMTFLPCSHWFHDQCVIAWLSEHNTCPHCRKGITDTSSQQQNPSTTPPVESASPRQRLFHPSTPPRPMPGAFDNGSPPGLLFGGSSTRSSPGRWDHDAVTRRPSGSRHSSHSHQSRSVGSRRSSQSDHTGGGITSRVRNFFGGGGGSGR